MKLTRRSTRIVAAVLAIALAGLLPTTPASSTTSSITSAITDGIDLDTKGDWAVPDGSGGQLRTYGTFAAVLPDSPGPVEHEVGGDRTTFPNYDETSGPGFTASDPFTYRVHGPQEAANPDVPLIPPAGTQRRAATCFGSPLSISVPLAVGSDQVTVLMLDFDRNGRVQDITVSNGQTSATQQVAGAFQGVYSSYDVDVVDPDGPGGADPLPVTIQADLIAGPNAVISGVFVDQIGGPAGGVVNHSTQDETTMGDWIGVYGADGYQLCGMNGFTGGANPWDPSLDIADGLPGLTVAGGVFVWNDAFDVTLETGPAFAFAWTDWQPIASSNPCYARFFDYTAGTFGPNTPGDRRATTWDSGDEINAERRTLEVDLHIPSNSDSSKDGFLVSFYFLDWDDNRTQQFKLTDLTRSATVEDTVVSDFGCGQYYRFIVPPNTDLLAEIDAIIGVNAILSGIFVDELDRAFEPAISLETYVRLDGGGDGVDLCEDHGKPSSLELRYTGDGNESSNHHQDPAKVDVFGDPLDTTPVNIRASDKSDPTDSKAKVFFEGTVNLGDTFVADAANSGSSDLGGNLYINITDTAGGFLQAINFHTSCSQPIVLGDQFGAVKMISFADGTGFTATLPDPGIGDDADLAPGPAGEVGDDVTWTYLATNTGDVSLTNVGLVDDAGSAGISSDDFTPVAIAGTGVNVGDVNGNGYFDPGETWTFTAISVASEGQYSASATVSGTPVDVATGDLIGGPVHASDPHNHTAALVPKNVCENGRPDVLTLRYTGDGADANNHSQSGTVVVSGDPNDAPSVHILVTDKEPSHSKAKTYFDGIVALDTLFTMDKAIAGTSSIGTNTYITVSTPDETSVLQSIQFHTSCSQPLFTGDQYGAAKVVGFSFS